MVNRGEEKRKICVIGPSDYYCSAVPIHTYCLTNAFAANDNNEVTAALIRKLTPKFIYPGRDHIGKQECVQPLTSNIKIYKKMDWYSPLSWLRGYLFLKKHRPDVIVMQWWTSATLHILLFLALLNKLSPKSKLIIELHEVDEPLEMGIKPIRIYAKIISPILMKCADAYTTHANTVKTEATETYSLKENKIYKVPIGLYDIHDPLDNKADARRELRISEDFVILHFGMIRKYKGLPLLIKAFNELPEEIAGNSRLLIAGEDWKEDVAINDLVETSRHKGQITFFGDYVPNEMVPKYFSVADIVVFPHRETCGSGATSLAMAYGKPIIASDLVTMRELLGEYEGVTYTQPGNVESIRNALENAYHVSCSDAGFPCYEPPSTTWAEVARQYDDIFKQLV